MDSNALLAKVEARIETQLLPANRRDYNKIVTAGMALALKGGPNSILAQLKDSKNPVHDAAVGAVHICLMMRKQSRGTMPIKSMVPAATTLMLKALEFAERTGMLTADEQTVSQATRILTDTVMRAFGLTPQRLHAAAAKVHAMTQDPNQMAKIREAAGMQAADGAKVVQPEGAA